MTKTAAKQADALLHDLFPICRSITGGGLRRTFDLLRQVTPFDLHEVPSGTACYDWTVPDEWNVRDAFVADPGGRRVIDFRQNNLHLVNYSEPFEGRLTFDELRPHLFTLPDLPDAIPYRTSYYRRMWGFCLTQKQFDALDREAAYHIRVDTTLAPGSLTYGEAALAGTSGQEFLVSTYACHPSLGNDNLSGIVLWTLLLRELRQKKLRHPYRFVIVPETIGALAWLAQNEARAKSLAGGFVLSTVAGPGKFGYKQSFRGDARVDRAARLAFRERGLDFIEYPFDVNGSDERQYSSPAFRIPVGTICKDKYYEYPYYHTSLDNLEFISAEALAQTLDLYLLAIEKLEQERDDVECDSHFRSDCHIATQIPHKSQHEQERIYRSKMPCGEPMLGKRGLYPAIGGSIKQAAASARHAERRYEVQDERSLYGSELDAIRWLMFHGDGQTSLSAIAEQTGLPVRQLTEVAEKLVGHGLLEEL
ncbi:MAG: dTDP-4-dehydrorhamnose 3 5-epimerase [Anaerolineaceae bacterium]|nr:MAG: dTDP-4-dehydrorhamnose 3 5-epimerase [Anaerolineaceae bacterium]